jgi:hypothetical protein
VGHRMLGEATVIIGDCLRDMREHTNLSQGALKRGQACFDATFHELKTAIRIRLSKHWRNWLGPSKCCSTNCFMEVKSRPNFKIFLDANPLMKLPGVAPARITFSWQAARLLSKTGACRSQASQAYGPKNGPIKRPASQEQLKVDCLVGFIRLSELPRKDKSHTEVGLRRVTRWTYAARSAAVLI